MSFVFSSPKWFWVFMVDSPLWTEVASSWAVHHSAVSQSEGWCKYFLQYTEILIYNILFILPRLKPKQMFKTKTHRSKFPRVSDIKVLTLMQAAKKHLWLSCWIYSYVKLMVWSAWYHSKHRNWNFIGIPEIQKKSSF